MRNNLEQYYKVLGLKLGASLEEVNQAYKDLAFIWHPDRVPKDNPRLVEKSAEKIKEINHARDLLRSFHRQNSTAVNSTAKSSAKSTAKSTPPRDYRNYRYSSYARPPYSGYQAKQSSKTSQPPYSSYQQRQPSSSQSSYSSYRQPKKPVTPPRPTTYYSYQSKQSVTSSKQETGSYAANQDNYQRPYHKDMSNADLRGANLKEKDLA